MAFQFPWTNFHELNLDWFLSKFKQFTNNYLGTTATAESVPYGTQPTVTVTGGELDDDTDIVDPFTFNFKIPAGAQGEQGEQGVPGQDGITPNVGVTTITGGHNVAFDYGVGDIRNVDFDVMNGESPQIDDTLSLASINPVQNKVITGELDKIEKMRKSNSNFNGQFKPYPFPDNRFGSLGVNVFTDERTFYTDYNPEAHKNSGGTTYYVSPTGSNSNNGLSEDTPKATIAGITLADGDTIILMDGMYTRYLFPSTINKSINIIAQHKRKALVINSDNNYSYSLVEGTTYTTARSNVRTVLMTLPGNKRCLATEVGSVALCKTRPFSWCNDGANFYINTGGLIVPNNNNTYLNLGTNTILLNVEADTSDVNFYIDGVTLVGGNLGGLVAKCSSSYDLNVHAIDCDFLAAFTSSSVKYDAVSILGAKAYFTRCTAGFSRKDGFNYHSYASKIPYGYEYECEGYCNGLNSFDSYTNNGSTSHDGAVVIRINGIYHDNTGTSVADVGTNTISLNLACISFNSKASQDGYNCDFSTQTNTTTTMWLDECIAYDSKFNIYASTGSTMNLHKCTYDTTNGGGTLNTSWNPYQ